MTTMESPHWPVRHPTNILENYKIQRTLSVWLACVSSTSLPLCSFRLGHALLTYWYSGILSTWRFALPDCTEDKMTVPPCLLKYTTTTELCIIRTTERHISLSWKEIRANSSSVHWCECPNLVLVPSSKAVRSSRCVPQPFWDVSLQRRRNRGGGIWNRTLEQNVPPSSHHLRLSQNASEWGTGSFCLFTADNQWTFNCHWSGRILNLPLWTNSSNEAYVLEVSAAVSWAVSETNFSSNTQNLSILEFTEYTLFWMASGSNSKSWAPDFNLRSYFSQLMTVSRTS